MLVFCVCVVLFCFAVVCLFVLSCLPLCVWGVVFVWFVRLCLCCCDVLVVVWFVVVRVLLCVRGVCLLFRCYVEFERDAFRVCVFVRVCL